MQRRYYILSDSGVSVIVRHPNGSADLILYYDAFNGDLVREPIAGGFMHYRDAFFYTL
jgi:hypothetical protein